MLSRPGRHRGVERDAPAHDLRRGQKHRLEGASARPRAVGTHRRGRPSGGHRGQRSEAGRLARADPGRRIGQDRLAPAALGHRQQPVQQFRRRGRQHTGQRRPLDLRVFLVGRSGLLRSRGQPPLAAWAGERLSESEKRRRHGLFAPGGRRYGGRTDGEPGRLVRRGVGYGDGRDPLADRAGARSNVVLAHGVSRRRFRKRRRADAVPFAVDGPQPAHRPPTLGVRDPVPHDGFGYHVRLGGVPAGQRAQRVGAGGGRRCEAALVRAAASLPVGQPDCSPGSGLRAQTGRHSGVWRRGRRPGPLAAPPEGSVLGLRRDSRRALLRRQPRRPGPRGSIG